jgi:hypothetical protein
MSRKKSERQQITEFMTALDKKHTDEESGRVIRGLKTEHREELEEWCGRQPWLVKVEQIAANLDRAWIVQWQLILPDEEEEETDEPRQLALFDYDQNAESILTLSIDESLTIQAQLATRRDWADYTECQREGLRRDIATRGRRIRLAVNERSLYLDDRERWKGVRERRAKEEN